MTLANFSSIVGRAGKRAETAARIIFLSDKLDRQYHKHRQTIWARYLHQSTVQLRKQTQSSLNFKQHLDSISLPARLQRQFSSPYDTYNENKEDVTSYIRHYLPGGYSVTEEGWNHIDTHFKLGSPLNIILQPLCRFLSQETTVPQNVERQMSAYLAVEPFVTFLYHPDRYAFPFIARVNLDKLKEKEASDLQAILSKYSYIPKFLAVVTKTSDHVPSELLSLLLTRASEIKTTPSIFSLLKKMELLKKDMCRYLTLTLTSRDTLPSSLLSDVISSNTFRTLTLSHCEAVPEIVEKFMNGLTDQQRCNVVLQFQSTSNLPLRKRFARFKTTLQIYVEPKK